MGGYLDAFVPAFGLIALGWVLKRRLLPDDRVWAGIERLVFWVLTPCLLVSALAPLRLAEPSSSPVLLGRNRPADAAPGGGDASPAVATPERGPLARTASGASARLVQRSCRSMATRGNQIVWLSRA
jgi:hypothetical protein